MSVVIVTGSAGLIGSEAAAYFASVGLEIVGVDNDMRRTFFGQEASTIWNRRRLQAKLGASYRHFDLDIRDGDGVSRLSLTLSRIFHWWCIRPLSLHMTGRYAIRSPTSASTRWER